MVFTAGRSTGDPISLEDDTPVQLDSDNNSKIVYDDERTAIRFITDGQELARLDGFTTDLVAPQGILTGTNREIGARGDINLSGKLSVNVRDVRNISNPSLGDVAFHDGSGNAGVGIAYFDGTNFQVLDGGTTP
jgi:hypothetical protein